MSNGNKNFLRFIGKMLVNALPLIIKSLSVIGTIALLLVAGGIFAHNIEYLHHLLEAWPSILKDFIVGLGVGIIPFPGKRIENLNCSITPPSY